MPRELPVKITALKESELEEADRIMRLAFGTFVGLPDPMAFAGDRSYVIPRYGAKHCKAIAARLDGRIIGSNFATRWGSFGFFGPLTVLPEFWEKGVAQQMLHATVKIFDDWGVRHSGLFTFAHSAKHVGLYQKFGYWPGYLTALMAKEPNGAADSVANGPTLLSSLPRTERANAVAECADLTNGIEKGLDLTEEIRAVLAKGTGDVVLTRTRGRLDGFAICNFGAGTEGGSKICYVKFGAARSGKGGANRFERLLEACEWLASSRGLVLEGGMNLARKDAFQRMRGRGFRVMNQGVAMHRPHTTGHNRPDVYVVDDWR